MEDLKLAFAFGVILCLVQNAQASPVVKVHNSSIMGHTVTFLGHKINQFLGVPFAKPPVGQLRFQKPVPVQNYPKVLKAVTKPPACLQYTTHPFPWYVTSNKSEDCLYLNIWAPADARPENPRAVMYYMYGGGDRYGGINDDLYDGIPLAALGDIIVVTSNYRLGYFGFFTSNSSDAPGNLGVWDALEGLKWVNQNIEAFGGDASRITMGGESSGAINAGILSISPLAKNLYSRIIVESASPAYKAADNNTQNLAFSQQLAKYLGCANDSFTLETHPKEVVQCLQGIDGEKISRADYQLAPNATSHLVPQFGDKIVMENPRVSISNGDFRCTDMLIGCNHDEGSFILPTNLDQPLFGFFGQNNPHVNRTLGENFLRQLIGDFSDKQGIMNHYLPPNLTEDTDYRIRHQVYTAAGDTFLLCPTVYYAEKCAEQNRNVYFYFFTHRPSVSPWAPWLGTTHFDEIHFVFGQPILHPDRYEPSEVVLSRQMVDIWSSFVKNGKPNIPWPLYSRQNPAYKYLGPDVATGADGYGPHASNCNFLRPLFGF